MGMPALLIDSDPKNCESLRKYVPARCRVVENRVEPWNIQDIIGNRSVGLLVLDMDGGEFDVLCAVESYPKVICVEHRDLVDNLEAHLLQQTPMGHYFEWAGDNDYTVVATTRVNTIMVRNDLLPKIRE
jgi:hypothetical protein